MGNVTHGFARSQAVLDVALEDDSVGLGEAESLVHGLQSVTVGLEGREDA